MRADDGSAAHELSGDNVVRPEEFAGLLRLMKDYLQTLAPRLDVDQPVVASDVDLSPLRGRPLRCSPLVPSAHEVVDLLARGLADAADLSRRCRLHPFLQ